MALIIVMIVDYNFSNYDVLVFFYMAIIAWTADKVGGMYVYAYSFIASATRFFFQEVHETHADLFWLFFNSFSANFLVAWMVTKKNTEVEECERVSMTDSLTNLANRRAFSQRLGVALAHTQRHREAVSIAYIDVDGFKQVNDRLGHAAGDSLLSCIGEHIAQRMRADDFAARLGGDEFGIIFVHSDCSSRLTERIKNELDSKCRCQYDISFSIGIVHYDGKIKSSPDEITRYADSLMYRVKKSSKNAIMSDFYHAEREEV